MSEVKKQVLGRGLSSLLNSSNEENLDNNGLTPIDLPTLSIDPGSTQPRRSFPEEELMALAISIKEKGVLQPILVRPHPDHEGKYEIVAGERRWRAAKRIELATIPALVRKFTDMEALQVGLLENLQRQDLDPIDEAAGYRRLAEEFFHTQETLSRIVGKSRSHIANMLRLLELPDNIKALLRSGKLSAGHGRALIGAEDPDDMAEFIIKNNLNVRQAETLAKQGLHKKDHGSQTKAPPSLLETDPDKEILRRHLCNVLSIPIDLVLTGRGGRIIITFNNATELDNLLQKFNQIDNPAASSHPVVLN